MLLLNYKQSCNNCCVIIKFKARMRYKVRLKLITDTSDFTPKRATQICIYWSSIIFFRQSSWSCCVILWDDKVFWKKNPPSWAEQYILTQGTPYFSPNLVCCGTAHVYINIFFPANLLYSYCVPLRVGNFLIKLPSCDLIEVF